MLLQRAFGAVRARQYYDVFDTNPSFGTTLCALALERNIEPEFVLRIIDLHGMTPPPEAGPSWPWPVTIETFGDFVIRRRGQRLAVNRKAQRKPLELARALTTMQGRAVDKRRVAERMWPDATADAGIAALDMVISRLRKLLGAPVAIVTDDGKVGFDARHVWVDAWAFDRVVGDLQAALQRGGPHGAVEPLTARMLGLYRGAFLEHEELDAWTLATRDRSRIRFLRTLADAGRERERAAAWSEAAALYERGLEIDPAAEDLYRQLMRCHIAQQHPAEAARVYQRCRAMLASQLDIGPSADTEALFRSLRPH